MKKIFLIALIAIVASSCSKTKDEIARDFIESKIKEGMNDPSSYEFASMTPLDSVLSEFKKEKEIIELEYEINVMKGMANFFKKKSEDSFYKRYYPKKEIEQAKDSLDYYTRKSEEKDAEMTKLEAEYIPRMLGYRTTFSFRGKNAFGAIIKNTCELVISENLDSIVGIRMDEK